MRYFRGVKIRDKGVTLVTLDNNENQPPLISEVTSVTMVTDFSVFPHKENNMGKYQNSVTIVTPESKNPSALAGLQPNSGSNHGVPGMPQKDRLKIVHSTVRDVSKGVYSKSAPIGFICNKLADKLDESTIKQDLAYLLKIGEVVEVSPGRYQTTEGIV